MSVIQITEYRKYADAMRHPFSLSLSKDDSQILGLSDGLDGNDFHRDGVMQEGSQAFFGR